MRVAPPLLVTALLLVAACSSSGEPAIAGPVHRFVVDRITVP